MDTTLACKPRGLALARAVLSLFKLRIGTLIMATALVGLLVTPGAALTKAQVAVLALSVLVASAAAGAFNQYVEHMSDRLMNRTRRRAFAAGTLPHHPAWLALMALMHALTFAAMAWLGPNDVFTTALGTGLRNVGLLAMDLSKRPHLKAWIDRIEARDAVKRALATIATIKSIRDTATDDQRDRFFARGKYARA